MIHVMDQHQLEHIVHKRGSYTMCGRYLSATPWTPAVDDRINGMLMIDEPEDVVVTCLFCVANRLFANPYEF